MRYKSKQSGFSAVELLITLFIAAVFLISGFELYAAIVKNGGDARMMASASSVVTDYIQQYKSTATNPCTVQTPLTNSHITVFGLSNVTVTVAIQCPYSSGTYSQGTTPNTVSEIIATVQYGTPQQTVSNATYVSYPNSGLITDGLVLNLDAGSTDSYPGSDTTWTDLSGFGNNGTLVNGVGYSADNGGSLTFDGADDYVRLPETGSLPTIANGSFSISSWSKITSKITTHNIVRRDNNSNLGAEGRMVIGLSTLLTSGYANFGFYNGTSYSAIGTIDRTNGNWHNFVGIYDAVGKNVYLYVDGILEASNLNVTPSSPFNTAREPWVIGSVNTISSYGEDMLGFIPSVQIYNRALTPSEINQSYNALKSRYQL